MHCSRFLGGVFGSAVLAAALPAAAYEVTSFDPNAFFTSGAAPLPAEVDALDAAAGLGGLDIERFEDLTLEPGLTVEFSGGPPLAVLPSGSLANEPGAAWDGSFSLSVLIDLVPSQPLVIRHGSGVDVIAVGLSGIDHAHELVVNGENLGPVDALPGFQPSPTDNRRSVFIRVEREPGDPLLEALSIVPDPLLANPNGDFIRIDHVATGSPVTVPSGSTPVLLLLATALGLVGSLRLRPAKVSGSGA